MIVGQIGLQLTNESSADSVATAFRRRSDEKMGKNGKYGSLMKKMENWSFRHNRKYCDVESVYTLDVHSGAQMDAMISLGYPFCTFNMILCQWNGYISKWCGQCMGTQECGLNICGPCRLSSFAML